jgi:4a-hydroxytetrahydrobiopterin dehydratase
MDLTAKTCEPCRGGIAPLKRDEAGVYLGQVPAWTLLEGPDRIERKFEFADFAQKVGVLAEREGHHPDVAFGWGYCTVSFFTHKIKGLHENDFIMAAKVDALT